MSYKTGFYEGRLGIGLSSTMGMGDGNPRYPLDINGDIRLTGSIVNGNGQVLSLTPAAVNWTIDDDDIFFTAGGNVGIGTDSPSEKLQVNGRLRIEAAEHSAGIWFIGNGVANDNGSMFFGRAGATFSGIGFWVNNWIHAFLDNGNVGIGTTNPSDKLVVDKASAQTKVQFGIGGNSYGTVMYIGGASGNQRKLALISEPEGGWCRSNLHFCLNTVGDYDDVTLSDSKMVIKNNGNVGIGTASPESMLHLKSSGDVILRLEADSDNSGESDNPMIFMSQDGTISQNNQYFKIGMNGDAGAAFTGALSNSAYLSSNDYLQFAVQGQAVMTMNYQNKYVGIGTTSPGSKLDILGLTATSDTFEDRMLRLSFSTGYSESKHGIEWYNTNVNVGLGAIRLEVGNNYLTPSMSFFIGGSDAGEKMRITNTGNVGIGTATPSAKLDVNGSIKARGIDGGNIGSKFLVTPVTNGTHNNNNVPSITGAGNWLEYHPHVDFDFILGFTSPYQMGMQIYLKDKQGNIIQEVGLHVGSTTASSGTYDPGYEGNNVALFVYNPEKKMYEFAYSKYWYNWGNDSTSKAAFNEVIDQAMPTDLIVLNGTGYNSRWMEYESETERLRTHFGSTESPYSGGWSSTLFAGIKGYGKILEFDTTGRGTERAAAVKIGDIHKWDDIDYSVAWTSDGTPNRTEAAALTSSDFCFMYNKYGGRIAKMKIHAVSDSDRVYVTLADGGSGQTAFSIDNNYAFIWPSKVKQGVEQAGGTWPSGAGTYGGWITMQGGQASYYWTADDGNNYYFAFGNYHAGRRRYMVNGTRNRRDDAWPVGSTRGTNVEIRDTHLTIKKRTDKFDYGNQTRMIEFKPYMSDRWNNSGSEFQPYTVKASINSGISSLRPSLNTETGFIAFHTADDGVLDERMRIEYNGNVGIGTSTPEENSRLHINGSHASCRMTTKEHSNYPNFQTNFFYGAHHIDVYQTSGAKGYGSTGNGTPMYFQYYSGGAVKLAGGTDVTSDDRLKHNEKIITNGLDIINQLEPKKYFKSLKRYDEEHNYDLDSSGNPITDDHYKIETGLIAQQVMTIPELKYLVDEVEDKYKIVNKEKIDESGNVILDDDDKPVIEEEEQISLKGRYTVNYQDIFVYNIAATKELYKENQELKTKVATLESQLAVIKQHLGI